MNVGRYVTKPHMDPGATFNAIADLYDAARPDYPAALFADLAGDANLQATDPILEIGCGTGLATQGLAKLSHFITALDPGAELLRTARSRLVNYPSIEFVQTSFEAWTPGARHFALAVAAQVFHWLSPTIRFPKIASLLRPGGVLAVFGNVPVLAAAPVKGAIERAYEQFAPHLAGPPVESWYLPDGPLPKLFAESGLFTAVRHRSYARVVKHTAESFTDFRRSLSSHHLLPTQQRGDLLSALAAAIEAHGGEIDVRVESHLYSATLSGRGHDE